MTFSMNVNLDLHLVEIQLMLCYHLLQLNYNCTIAITLQLNYIQTIEITLQTQLQLLQ